MTSGALYDIVPASVRHVRPLSASLRPAACMTLQAFGLDVRAALRRAFVCSTYRRTALIAGEPVGMWGMSGSLMGDRALVWLALGALGAAHPIAAIRCAQRELEEMSNDVSSLYAMVAENDERAMIFARSIGFSSTDDFEVAPGTTAMIFRRKCSPRLYQPSLDADIRPGGC